MTTPLPTKPEYLATLKTVPAPTNPEECSICRYGSWDNTEELTSVNVVEPSAGRYPECKLHPLHLECLLRSFVSEDGTREVSNLCPTCRRELFQKILPITHFTPLNFNSADFGSDDDDEDKDEEEDGDDLPYYGEEDAGFNEYLTVRLDQGSADQDSRNVTV
jgi:hypothetical protein